MALRAGFAEIDITPPMGVQKIGWLKVIVADRVLDPLSARVAAFDDGRRRVGFIQLDTLFIEAGDVQEIRRRIERQHGLPGDGIMVAATHNHAGPAVCDCGDARRDEEYVGSLVEKVVEAFGRAMASLRPARAGFGSGFEFDVSFNRRVVMRDGTVRTQQAFDRPDALCLEGPIDPELAVVAVQDDAGQLIGAIVNFACHPTHHGGETAISAGYPGVLAAELKARGCPVTLFLNGACGNIIHHDYAHGGRGLTKEQVGGRLADDAWTVIRRIAFQRHMPLRSASKTILVPWRAIDDGDIRGTARGAQRFIDPAIYQRMIPRFLERMKAVPGEQAEVQVLSLGEVDFVAIPAEYFVQEGLYLKQKAHPRHALVVSCANGNLNYVPHAEAFDRGGYEVTFPWGRFDPRAGRMLADAGVDLIWQNRPAEA